ncbi:MAG: hypothetical protein KDA79_03290 [Planctomycetaceae bacterium]|nr:hypothetical protein [Planctomycetaceae bacterium]
MPGWLSRASGAIRKTPAAVEEPFERACIQCGLPLAGVRTAKPQVISCSACSQQNFILPVSPYPPLKEPRQRKRDKPGKRAAGAGRNSSGPDDAAQQEQAETADIRTVAGHAAVTVASPETGTSDTGSADSATREAMPGRSGSGQRAPGRKGRSRPSTGGSVVLQAGQGREADGQIAAPAGRRRLRLPAAGAAAWRFYTPVRAVVAGCLLVLLLTVWWGVRRRNLEQAAVTIHLAEHNGDALLAEGRLGAAAEEFARAAEAADLLDRGDMQSRRVHQKHQELLAAARLSSTSLVEILELAASRQGRGDVDWPEQLTESHAGSWFLLETAVTRAAADRPVEVSCPLMIAGLPVQLRADLNVFQSLPIEASPQQAIFAAALLRVSAEQTPEPHWVLEFRPDSGILLTRPGVCEALGLSLDEGGLVSGGQEQPLRALLARQMGWLELEEAEDRPTAGDPAPAAEGDRDDPAALEEENRHEPR